MIQLQQARARLGLTQEQLAERAGLHPSALSRIEGGKRDLSFSEAVRLAQALHVPLEWFVSGEVRPGTSLADIAAELWHLGVQDLIVPGARVPGAYRPAEEVVALAVGTERPDPRVVEALPAVLAWNRWRPGVLEAFACATHPRAITRLAWLAELALTLDRTGGFPGGLLSGDDLMALLDRVDRPEELDSLGHPGAEGAEHRAWKYWRVTYAATLDTFRERAEHLWGLMTRRPDA